MGVRKAYLLGTSRAHLVAEAEGRMGTAACGVHPYHPDQWHWESEVARPLGLCPRCCTSRQENPMNNPDDAHLDVRSRALTDAEIALHSALAELARAQIALTATDVEVCGSQCCPSEVETEDADADLGTAARRIRGVLRLVGTRQGRLDAIEEDR